MTQSTKMSDMLKLLLTNFDKLEEFESLLKQPVDEYYAMVDSTNRSLKHCVTLDIAWPAETTKRWSSIHQFACYVYAEHLYICEELLKITQDVSILVEVIGGYSIHERLLEGFTSSSIIRAIGGEIQHG
jgi:hypothetical protein